MTAAELQAINQQACEDTSLYQGLTEQARLTGAVFRFDEPLPPLPNHRTHREWETPKEGTR